MKTKRQTSIRAKLILFLGAALGSVFALSGYLVVSGVFSQNKADARLYMESLSREYANKVDTILERPLDTARTLASAMTAYTAMPAENRRTAYMNILKSSLAANPTFLGIWTLWEPDSLDGGDASSAGNRDLGSDSLGHFTPYFVRNGPGIILQVPEATDGYEAAYYQIPRNTRKEYLSEPYVYPLQGKEVLILSTVAPIIVQGRFLGVVGINLSTDTIEAELGKLSLYKTGFGTLISNEGIVVSHDDPTHIGKQAPEWSGEEREGIVSALASGQSFTRLSHSVALERDTLRSFVPVIVGDSSSPWMYGTVVPEEETYASVMGMLTTNIIILSTGFILVIVAIWLLAGSLLKPLRTTRLALQEIAQGEGDLTKTLVIRSRDEMGILADSFNTFVSNLGAIIAGIRDEMAKLQGLGTELAGNMDQTSTAIIQINSNIESVGRSFSQQHGAVSEVSSTVEEIVGNIASLNRLVREQTDHLGTSASAVEQMVANMQSITKNVDISMAAFTKLQEVSEQGYDRLSAVTETIGRIATQSRGLEETNDVIKSIASQTNLLAMNAAIEAAHAGDAGRGFAVVADEIRKLAEGTAARSKDISEVLQALTNLIQSAVNLSSDAGHSFESVRSSVQEVNTRQRDIRNAVEEQGEGNQQVLDSVERLRRISAEVESGSQEMSTGSNAILRSVHTLADATSEIQRAMDEISSGTADMNRSVIQVTELSKRTMTGIETVEASVHRFKVK
ncbi:MAG: methyl-accepting chemotaxis protein [Spirochaetota bacterium]